MKKIFIITGIMFFAVSLFGASWNNYDDYRNYLDAKKKASEAAATGDTTTAVAKYKEAAALAAKSSSNKEHQAWQLNNAAYTLITWFKSGTAYQEKIDALSGMTPGREKKAYQVEIAALFYPRISMLDEARVLLEEGAALFPAEQKEAAVVSTAAEAVADMKPAGPKDKIESNLEFVNFVTKFIADNSVAVPLKKETPALEIKK